MADAPSYDDLFRAGRNEVLLRPTRFEIDVVDAEGSDINILVAFAASVGDEAVRFSTSAFNETQLSTSARIGGEVLERWVWDRYQLLRLDSEQSVVTLSFSRTDTTIPESFDAGSLAATSDGQTFEIVNDVVFPLGQSGPLDVDAFNQVAGTLGNVESGTVTTILTSIGNSTLVVTNTGSAAGGTESETDEALAERARDFFINARRGTRTAILNGALTTPGVESASVEEFLNVDGIPNFRVQLVIADANGNANAALAARVTTRMEEFRGLGVPVLILPGAPQFVDIELVGITFPAGSNTTALINEIRLRVVDEVNSTSPGQTLRVAAIISAVRLTRQVNVPDNAVVQPAGDLVPTESGNVIRTTSSRVTINGLSGTF